MTKSYYYSVEDRSFYEDSQREGIIFKIFLDSLNTRKADDFWDSLDESFPDLDFEEDTDTGIFYLYDQDGIKATVYITAF